MFEILETDKLSKQLVPGVAVIVREKEKESSGGVTAEQTGPSGL